MHSHAFSALAYFLFYMHSKVHAGLHTSAELLRHVKCIVNVDGVYAVAFHVMLQWFEHGLVGSNDKEQAASTSSAVCMNEVEWPLSKVRLPTPKNTCGMDQLWAGAVILPP
jgi:hypothetical protein